MRKFNRKSIRLKNRNYASAGNYYVTIKTKGNAPLFGNLSQSQMNLSSAGEMVKKCIEDIPKHFPSAEASTYVILPDHLHLIISINENALLYPPSCQLHSYQNMTPRSLASIVKGLKIGVTKWFRSPQGGNAGPNFVVWQRNYYEHVIRSNFSYYLIQNYIETNVEKHLRNENSKTHTTLGQV